MLIMDTSSPSESVYAHRKRERRENFVAGRAKGEASSHADEEGGHRSATAKLCFAQ